MDENLVLEKRRKTQLVLSNIYNLPGTSKNMLEVTKLLNNPDTSGKELSKVIGKDQGIATKILAIANSPMYGLRRRVSTIDFAILVIGLKEIKNIIFALSMMESFKNKTDQYLNQKEFWLHSIVSGNASKRIAEKLDYKKSGEAFAAGLLHDLGIPVIHKYFHSTFIEIFNTANSIEQSYLSTEMKLLGCRHQEIGHFLTDKWNLPVSLCDAVLNHHNPSSAEEDKVLCAIVHLADYMTQKFKLANFYWDDELELDLQVLEILNFENENEFEIFTADFKDLFYDEVNSFRI